MTTQRTLPVIIISSPVMLPGNEINFTTSNIKNLQSIARAVETFDNKLVVFFKDKFNTATKDAVNYGLYSTIKNIKEKEQSIEIITDSRAKLVPETFTEEDYTATVEIETLEPASAQQTAVFSEIREIILNVGKDILSDSAALLAMLNSNVQPAIICDTLVSMLTTTDFNKYDFLAEFNFTKRLDILLSYLKKIFELELKITDKVMKELSEEQKEYLLHKKIKVIQEELGDIDSATRDADELQEKIKTIAMPPVVKERMLKELKRYKSTPGMSPESTLIRSYIDLMLELPWSEETTDNLDINAAKAKLDETHFGLEKVKDRILEYLSVKLYTGKNPQTILCLAGAPGVGKTTLARSIADALGRKFVKQSMGGVKDEAEIRGHRRTYIGALPGRIINGIKEAGVVNPVFLLDEIDKIGSDYKGDPSAALLEVLDPAQNVHFMDHYTEVEYDLSKVMFICTANYLENVPAPLKDRMEIIELSSYTELEKFQIGKNYVVKRSLDKNGLEPEKFEITDNAIKYLIKYYTREAGARQLERCMDSLVRKAIKKILSDHCEKVVITEDTVTEMLGKKLFDFNDAVKEDLVGTVTGLAYTQAGGDTLQIEVTTYPGKGNLQLTGKLGDVMKESAQAACSWVKSHAAEYNIDFKKFEENDIHIHVPEGATPKDGPSAGVTMTTALVSALSNRPVHHELGMTGEVTLRGKVLPIGGLKEKSIAAYRNGLKKILIPQDNIKDLEDIPDEVKEHLEIIPVSTIQEVLSNALI